MHHDRDGTAQTSSLATASGAARLQRIVPRGTGVVPEGYAQVWLCLRGPMTVDSVDGCFALGRGDLLTLPAEHRGRAASTNAGSGVVLLVPETLLRTQRRAPRSTDRGLRPVFALRARASRGFVRAVVHALRRPDAPELPMARALEWLRAAFAEQVQVTQWLQRIAGRSEGHRHHALHRLLRARNRIVNMPFERYDLDMLALTANYSKSHFIRMFREVFDTTPGALLASARIDMAKSLIVHSDLAIADIAADVGYENRFAFSRLFKKRVGESASRFRSRCAQQQVHA